MRRTEIDGARVVHEFSVMRPEWECDAYGWITEDGRAWMTNHGSTHQATAGELLEAMDVALGSVTGIREGLALMEAAAARSDDSDGNEPPRRDEVSAARRSG